MPMQPYTNRMQTNIVLPTGPDFRLDLNQVQEQNQRLLQQDGALPGMLDAATLAQRNRETLNDAIETFYPKHNQTPPASESYQQAFSQLLKLDPNNFSITKAVFTVESAYFNNRLSDSQFNNALHQRVELVRQILKREGLSPKNNLALNYGIQQLYEHENVLYNAKTGQSVTYKPFQYDFDDFLGEKDYSKMFASKMLVTGKGQCHGEPLGYLIIAEQLGAKAYLSLAPQHSFIRFMDNDGRLLNFETTSGNIVSENWLTHSGYITTTAMQSKTYLDTLSQRQLYAQVLGDLLLGYIAKFHRYDAFAEQIRQTVLQFNPDNLTALIVGANQKVRFAREQIQAAGRPRPEDLPNYPEAYKAYLEMNTALEKVDNMGYQDMPKEAYQHWLQSIEQEKQRQAHKELKANMEREIQQIKKLQEAIQKQLKQ